MSAAVEHGTQVTAGPDGSATRVTAVLALDLGTRMGWAIRGPSGAVTHGWSEFRNDRFSGGGMRFLRFERWLDTVYQQSPSITEVHFEEVRRHAGTSAAQVYGGFLAILTKWCDSRGIAYQGHAVGQIKRAFTGSGNASKEAMVAEAKRRGFDVKYDDEADALAILDLATGSAPERV